MKAILILLVFMSLLSCESKIYPTKTTVAPTITNENCKEFHEFVKMNMFYVEEDDSYLYSRLFLERILTYRYKECMGKLNFEEAIALFGKPRCQTDKEACYYSYMKLPNNVTYDDIRLDEKSFCIVIKKKGNNIVFGNECSCND